MSRVEKIAVTVAIIGSLTVSAICIYALWFVDWSDPPDPIVSAHLRTGYGLSTTKRPGWVPIIYKDRLWYVEPADLIP